MSNEEHNAYMKDVKWTTNLYIVGSLGTVLLAVAGMYYGLKDDNKTSRQIEQVHYVATNHKIDSINHDTKIELANLRNDISNLPQPKNTTIIKTNIVPKGTVGLFTARYVDGKLGFFPVK